MKRSLVWLASYPKSGNTWLRVFLANYLRNSQTPLSINQVQQFGFGDSSPPNYNMVAGKPVDTSNPRVTLPLRDGVLRLIVANNADVNFVKTHNIRSTAFNVELIPAKYTRSAIYVIRNPLDMVLSYARHYGLTQQEAIKFVGSSENGNSADETSTWQFLGSWSDHVKSWTQGTQFPVLTLRYEEMLANPHESFGQALKFLGVTPDPDRLDRAVRFSSFDELRQQEEKSGFIESSPNSEKFFDSGKSGRWKDELPQELIQKIRRDHKRMMKKHGYYNV